MTVVALIYFITDAKDQVKEYMLENTEWQNMNEDDLEEFKEKIVNALFIDTKFYTLYDCAEYVENKAIALAEIIDYMLEREEFDNCKTTVELFNHCWYLIADFIYDDDEWLKLTNM
jgi:hypothetical protein